MASLNSVCRGSIVVAALLLLLATVPIARGQTLDQGNLEMSMAEATSNLFLAWQFGDPGTSTINYSTDVDPGGTFFNFSTMPNQLFQNQPVAVSGSGTSTYSAFPDGELWSWDSLESIEYQGFLYSAVDETTVTVSNGMLQVLYSVNYYDAGGVKIGDAHTTVPNAFALKSNAGTGYLTDDEGDEIPDTGILVGGSYNAGSGAFEIDLLPAEINELFPYFIYDDCDTDPVTGLGTIQTVIVPEPCAAGVMAVGALAVARRRERGLPKNGFRRR